MWKTGGVTYGHAVDNLSGTVENPTHGRVSGPHSELRIPGSFQRNMLIVGLNESKMCGDTHIVRDRLSWPLFARQLSASASEATLQVSSIGREKENRPPEEAGGLQFQGNRDYAFSSSTVCRMTPWAEMSRTNVSAPASSSIIAFCIALATFSALAGSARAAMLGPAPDRKLP
jgi:hypothetical protein